MGKPKKHTRREKEPLLPKPLKFWRQNSVHSVWAAREIPGSSLSLSSFSASLSFSLLANWRSFFLSFATSRVRSLPSPSSIYYFSLSPSQNFLPVFAFSFPPRDQRKKKNRKQKRKKSNSFSFSFSLWFLLSTIFKPTSKDPFLLFLLPSLSFWFSSKNRSLTLFHLRTHFLWFSASLSSVPGSSIKDKLSALFGLIRLRLQESSFCSDSKWGFRRSHRRNQGWNRKRRSG